VLGLIENLPQTLALLNRFPWSAWKQLRLDALQHTFQAKIAGQTVQPLLLELLNIAQAGLQQRGLNEDIFLSPLFQRYQQQQSPADQMIQLFQQQGLTAVLQQLSFNRHLG
jgi:gamma-glutamylcysteine synthetase